jgi:hypothetical protein
MDISDLVALEELSDLDLKAIVGGGIYDSNAAYMALLDQSTAQTRQIQMALLNHNLAVGPVMAAKSASEDAKKT